MINNNINNYSYIVFYIDSVCQSNKFSVDLLYACVILLTRTSLEHMEDMTSIPYEYWT